MKIKDIGKFIKEHAVDIALFSTTAGLGILIGSSIRKRKQPKREERKSIWTEVRELDTIGDCDEDAFKASCILQDIGEDLEKRNMTPGTKSYLEKSLNLKL